MTSKQVWNIVQSEIGDRWDSSNLHVIVLRRCFITSRNCSF